MWNSDDPKSKLLHLVVKLVAAIIIFKLGIMVGEFKVIKAMVLGGSPHPKMLFRGDDKDGNRYFEKRLAPMMDGNRMMFWRGDKEAEVPGPGTPVPLPAQ